MKKYYIANHQKITQILLSLFLIIFISACDNSETSSTEIGSASFSIEWPPDVPTTHDIGRALGNPDIDCVNAGISTVDVDVYNGNDDFLISQSWPCSDGGGIIDNIPAGTDRRFVAFGTDENGTAVYTGEKSGITIIAGGITQVGSISIVQRVACTDADSDGYYVQSDCDTAVDCNDGDNSINPGITEICDDGIDQNCNGEVDEGGCAEPRFTDMGDGTVRDNLSGLIWLKDASCSNLTGTDVNGKADWDKANNVAAAGLADGICGLTDGSSAGDWRLPTKDEWEAFVDKRYDDPALSNAAGTAQWSEGDAFIGAQPSFGYHWSSTEFDTSMAWSIWVNLGIGLNGDKVYAYYVWPVRPGN